MVLNNAIKVLLNHVPYDKEEFDKLEFIESEEEAMQELMSRNNFLQPLGVLGCRSMASFLPLHEGLADNLDSVILNNKKRETLLGKF